MGIGENVVARILNHASEIGKTITGAVYIRHSFATEKRHALEAWGDNLALIVTGAVCCVERAQVEVTAVTMRIVRMALFHHMFHLESRRAQPSGRWSGTDLCPPILSVKTNLATSSRCAPHGHCPSKEFSEPGDGLMVTIPTVRFHMVTVFSREAGGRTFQCRTNEIENVGSNTCSVNDMRAASVRLVP